MGDVTHKSFMRQVQTNTADTGLLLERLRSEFPLDDLETLLVFVSPQDFELDALGEGLYEIFGDRVVGCTSAGQFGKEGYQLKGLMAIGFYGSWYIRPCLVSSLKEHNDQFVTMVNEVETYLEEMPEQMTPFGVILVDGLSMQEERLMAHLYKSLVKMPIVGGSAGDALNFDQTSVLYQGRFVSNAALFLVCGTTRCLSMIHAQHHIPTDVKLVVTEADPERRRVIEINGYPAARAYSEAINVSEEALCPTVFSQHPLTLNLGNGSYIRSIQSKNEDGSLSFYCAVERGIVLSLARPVNPIEVIDEAFKKAKLELGSSPEWVLGFDCILRRLEYEACDLKSAMEANFKINRVSGFFTYGEQIDGLHVNQTFTGIAFGEERG